MGTEEDSWFIAGEVPDLYRAVWMAYWQCVGTKKKATDEEKEATKKLEAGALAFVMPNPVSFSLSCFVVGGFNVGWRAEGGHTKGKSW